MTLNFWCFWFFSWVLRLLVVPPCPFYSVLRMKLRALCMLASILLTELHIQFLMSLLLFYIYRNPVLSVGTYRDFRDLTFPLQIGLSFLVFFSFSPESATQVAQVSSNLMYCQGCPWTSIFLLSFKCSDYRHAPPHLACMLPFKMTSSCKKQFYFVVYFLGNLWW